MKKRLVAIVVGAMIIIIFGMTFESIQYRAREVIYKQPTATQTSNQCWI